MINKVACLLALVVSFISFNTWAWDPPPAPHPPQSYIADVAHKLSSNDLSSLNNKIRLVNRSSRNEIAILIVPTLGDEAMSDVANSTFKAWKVGKKDLDNGVLIVLALKEHKARIEVGKGIEGDLTDLQSSEIIRDNIFPHWKKGNIFAGLAEAVDMIARTVESRKDAGSTNPALVPVKQVTSRVPSIPNIPAQPNGCSYSAGSTSDNGATMLTLLLFVLVIYGVYRFVKYWVVPSPIRYNDYLPRPPRYEPAPACISPPVPVYEPPVRYSSHNTYYHAHDVYELLPTPAVYETVMYTHTPEPTPTVVETLGVVTGFAAVSSMFSAPDPEPIPSYSNYEPAAEPSYESTPSPNDDVGFGGGDSGGGGAEESWSDSSSDSGSSDDS